MEPKLDRIGGAGAPGTERAGQLARARATSAAPRAEAAGAAPDVSFEALLERLEAKAQDLGTRPVDGAEHLADAVDDARASLESALDLGRDLLEAFRQARLDDQAA